METTKDPDRPSPALLEIPVPSFVTVVAVALVVGIAVVFAETFTRGCRESGGA